MEKILENKRYEMFDLTPFNRDVKKEKYLEASMRKHGFISAYPLHVIKNGSEKYLIKAGHHRFHVARKLGIPVKYIVCDDDATIHELEKATTPWSVRDYLESYCRMGKEEYMKLRFYCEETGIQIGHAASMLMGGSAGSGNYMDNFKDGTYKTKSTSHHAELVKDIVLYLKRYGIPFYNTSLLVQAISKIMWVEGFDPAKLKTKIKNFHGFIEKKANLEQYLDMLEELYNRQSQSKIPLKFLANEMAKKRSIISPRKK